MALPTLQKTVADFIAVNQLETAVQFRLLDLTSEIGEVAKEVLKGTNYGREQFQVTRDWTEELGDALFSLICIANSTSVDLEEALNKALDKYKTRLDSKSDASSGR